MCSVLLLHSFWRCLWEVACFSGAGLGVSSSPDLLNWEPGPSFAHLGWCERKRTLRSQGQGRLGGGRAQSQIHLELGSLRHSSVGSMWPYIFVTFSKERAFDYKWLRVLSLSTVTALTLILLCVRRWSSQRHFGDQSKGELNQRYIVFGFNKFMWLTVTSMYICIW